MKLALTTSSRNRSVRTRCVPRTRISALSVDKSGAFAPRIGSWQGRTRELQTQPYKLGLSWTTLGKLIPMNSQHLHLALTTPLENLLGIPQGIQLALDVRDGLKGVTPEQAVAILRAINGMIESALLAHHELMGSEFTTRNDYRDIEWLMQALVDQIHLVPVGQTNIPEPVYFLVLAAYKLGCVIDQRLQHKTPTFSAKSVANLLEAQQAWAYAELIPPQPTVEEIMAKAWSEGLTPEPMTSAVDTVHKAQLKRATDARHHTNRIAKKQAIDLYLNGNYRTIDAAATSIAEQVFRAPGTVRNWIFQARRERDLSGK